MPHEALSLQTIAISFNHRNSSALEPPFASSHCYINRFHQHSFIIHEISGCELNWIDTMTSAFGKLISMISIDRIMIKRESKGHSLISINLFYELYKYIGI